MVLSFDVEETNPGHKQGDVYNLMASFNEMKVTVGLFCQ